MKICTGIPYDDREKVAALYWEAFGGKLGKVLGPRDRAMVFICDVMRSDHGICAHDKNGKLLGVVGFKTPSGALVGGEFKDMQRVYGRFGAIWRTIFLTLLENEAENTRFLMDGLFVAEDARGQGVGTALLTAIAKEAKQRGFTQVRLDVIDTNMRARALYLREGYTVLRTHKMGLLGLVFGFRAVTSMVASV